MAKHHSRPPIHRLSKKEIQWLSAHTCEAHSHSYLEHYNCYLAEQPGRQEKIGFLDIECTGLKADWAYMLTYCILDNDSGKIIKDILTMADIQGSTPGEEDKRLVASCIANMAKFDRLVTYYGTNYDLPVLRSRALTNGLEFPEYSTQKHTDVYFIIKSKFNMSSKRQENACRVLLGSTDKTRIDPRLWKGAARGDKKSVLEVLHHNEADVRDLQKLYNKVKPYVGKRDTSI